MWEVWYPEVQAKLRIDHHALGGTEEAKFWYIYGRLEKKVQSLVSPQLQSAEVSQSYDPQELFDQLARLCDNPNAKREAQDKLYGLRQFPDQSFNYYLAAFERQIYKAGADKWSDDAKIALLRRQLNDKLKRRLRTQISMPEVYSDFVRVLQQLDTGDEASKKSSGHSGGDSRGEPMQIGKTTAAIRTLIPYEIQGESSDSGSDWD